jgi:ribosomal-protein-alanine N-acetyltransferase
VNVLARGDRVVLRRPTGADLERFCASVEASEALHDGWVHPPRTPVAYQMWLEAIKKPSVEAHLATTYDGRLAGVVNINNIFRGSLQSGSLGYYGFAETAGLGLVRESVAMVLRRAFRELGLHRVEANIQPGNSASRRLVEALSFRYEGFSPSYLMVGGRWCDHDRFALLGTEA